MGFNYTNLNNSNQLKCYDGPNETKDGYSTEDCETGGGYLESDIYTPLSTTGVRTCPLLNFLDENSGHQVLFHVYNKTTSRRIEEFIKEKMPDFTCVNIYGGDQNKTVNTMKKIIQAIDNVNPKARKHFYHTNIENPEIVAYEGKLYRFRKNSGKISFVPNVDNYWY